MVKKNWEQVAQKIEQSENPKPPEVKKPGFFSKLLDKFGKGNRWEQELAYIEAQEEEEEEETPTSNEQATQATREILEETAQEANGQTAKTTEELNATVAETISDNEDPEVRKIRDKIQAEINATRDKFRTRIEELQTLLKHAKYLPKSTENSIPDSTIENSTTSKTTEQQPEIEQQQIVEIQGILQEKFPNEIVDQPIADKIRIKIDAKNREGAGSDNFGNIDETVNAYNTVLEEENPTILKQANTIMETIGDDISREMAHDIRRKIDEWNQADKNTGINHFDNPDQIREAFKQVSESIANNVIDINRKQKESSVEKAA